MTPFYASILQHYRRGVNTFEFWFYTIDINNKKEGIFQPS